MNKCNQFSFSLYHIRVVHSIGLVANPALLLLQMAERLLEGSSQQQHTQVERLFGFKLHCSQYALLSMNGGSPSHFSSTN